MNDVTRTAIELRDLVERFASLSEGALRASADADTAVLGATLDARDLLLARATTLAAQLRERRATLGTAERRALDEFLRPVERAADHAGAVNARLRDSALGARVRIGDQLDQLRVETEAAQAYRHPVGAGRALDTTR